MIYKDTLFCVQRQVLLWDSWPISSTNDAGIWDKHAVVQLQSERKKRGKKVFQDLPIMRLITSKKATDNRLLNYSEMKARFLRQGLA